MHLVIAGPGHQCRRPRAIRGCAGDVGDHRIHFFRIGPCGFGGVLRAAQLWTPRPSAWPWVIFCVALVEAMRTRMSLSEAFQSNSQHLGCDPLPRLRGESGWEHPRV